MLAADHFPGSCLFSKNKQKHEMKPYYDLNAEGGREPVLILISMVIRARSRVGGNITHFKAILIWVSQFLRNSSLPVIFWNLGLIHLKNTYGFVLGQVQAFEWDLQTDGLQTYFKSPVYMLARNRIQSPARDSLIWAISAKRARAPSAWLSLFERVGICVTCCRLKQWRAIQRLTGRLRKLRKYHQ